MRYHYGNFSKTNMYGHIYECDHEVYSKCTLYLIGNKGIAVIQQRFDAKNKSNDKLYLEGLFTTPLIFAIT